MVASKKPGSDRAFFIWQSCDETFACHLFGDDGDINWCFYAHCHYDWQSSAGGALPMNFELSEMLIDRQAE